MTIGTDEGSRTPENQNDPADQNQQQTQVQTPAAELDIDEIELQAALKEAKAEETSQQANGTETGDGQSSPQAGTTEQQANQQQGQQGQGHKPEPVMIPKPRFDDVLGRATKAEQEAAYWRGVAEARGQQQAPQGGHAPVQQQQQADPLADIHAKQDELAAEFDRGEISMAQFNAANRELASHEQALREERLLAKARPQQPQAKSDDTLYLETLTADLETQHPWVYVFDQLKADADWNYVRTRAIENLTSRGVDPRSGDIGKYELRKEMAQLCDQLGPSLIGERARAAGINIPGQQQQQQQKAPLSPQAENRKAKLAMGQNAPLDLTAIGGAGNEPGYSDARIESMSDEDIANLPDGVKQKILSGELAR